MKNSTIGVFLNLGESFTSLGGQAELMISQNIKAFAKNFSTVYVFTYKQESVTLPSNCILITPPLPLHRYIYALLLPVIHCRIIHRCNLLRCFQLSGTIPALMAKLIYGSKFVFNYGYDYAAFARIEGKPIQALLFSQLSLIAVKFAAGVIVKNKSLKIKGHYLPNGVDTHLFKLKQSYRMSVPPTLLYVGRLEPQKNLLNLVSSLSDVAQPIKLILVGQGSQQRQLRQTAKRLGVNLVIRSALNHRDLPQVYRSADIFVLPSLAEGSPKVLLEAMVSGLPCIASDIAVHKEIINSGKTGLLVKPKPVNLSQAINSLLSSSHERAKFGRAARRHIQASFDITPIIEQEITILKSV